MFKKFDIEERPEKAGSRGVMLLVAITLLLLPRFPARAALPGDAAAPEADSLRNYAIDSVAVTARLTRDVVPAQTLSGVELERLSAHSVADAIRYFSGVTIKDYGGVGGLKTVNVRSMGTHHVGVFYDGMQIGNAQNGVVDLGRFSLDNMEAVSLYNGQKSSLLQPAGHFASASAIYLRSRRPTFDGGRTYNAKASVRAGSFGTVNPSALWEQKIGRRVSASVGAEYLYTDGRYRFQYENEAGYVEKDKRRNSDVEAVRAEASFFGDIAGGEWQAKAYLYDSERGYPGATGRNYANRPVTDRQWDTNLFVQGSLRKAFSSAYSLLVSGKYAYDRMKYNSDRFRQQEAYVSAANLFSILPWWSAALSADYRHNRLRYSLKSVTDREKIADPDRNSLLAAVSTSLTPGPVSVQAALLYTYAEDRTRTKNGRRFDRFTPSVVVSWQPLRGEELTLRAFYKHTYRLPTFNDLYYTNVGNASLRPESAKQYDLGASWSRPVDGAFLRAIHLQADAYYNEVDDKIVAMPATSQFRWTMLNIGYTEITGVDAMARADLRVGSVNGYLLLNYTYQEAEDRGRDRSDAAYGHQIPYIPWHSGSAVLGIEWRGWEFNYSVIYTGKRYVLPENNDENYMSPWFVSDLSLSKEFPAGSTRIRATAEVNNIFGRDYEVVRWYPMPKTSFNFKISVKL